MKKARKPDTGSRGQLKCDGTRAETRFRLSAKRASPFKSAGASVQSTTGSRGVRISGSNAGYTTFRGRVKGTGYPIHSPVSTFTSPPVRHCVQSHFNCSLPVRLYYLFFSYKLFQHNVAVYFLCCLSCTNRLRKLQHQGQCSLCLSKVHVLHGM